MQPFPRSLVLVMATVGLWSGAATLGKLMSQQHSGPVLLLSFSFSVVACLINLLMTRNGRAGMKRIPAKWLIIGPLGYYGYWMCYLACFSAFARSSGTASEPTVLNYTWPVFTLLFSGLFAGRTPHRARRAVWLEYIAVGVAFAGIYLLATEGTLIRIHSLAGIGWGLLAGASYGGFSAFSRTLPEEDQPAFLLVSAATSALLMGLTVLIQNEVLDYQVSITGRDALLAALSGLLVDGLGYVLWTRALAVSVREGISLGRITALLYWLPLLSLGIVSLWFGEHLLARGYFAASVALVMLGSALGQNSGRLVEWWQRRK